MDKLIISEHLLPRVEAMLEEKIEQQSFSYVRNKLEELIDKLEKGVIEELFTDKIHHITTPLTVSSTDRLLGQELYKVYDSIMEENLN